MQLIKSENYANVITTFKTMRILITPFHMTPSSLASNNYLPNTDSDHSMMLATEVWKERDKKYLTVIVHLCHSCTEIQLLASYCLKQ